MRPTSKRRSGCWRLGSRKFRRTSRGNGWPGPVVAHASIVTPPAMMGLKGDAIRHLVEHPAEDAGNKTLDVAADHAAGQVMMASKSAVDWVESLPDGTVKLKAQKSVALRWGQLDPSVARRWAASLPTAERREVEAVLMKSQEGQ